VSGAGAASGAFVDGLMNEKPCANAPAHKKANITDAMAVLFANPKVANCKTVDLTNLGCDIAENRQDFPRLGSMRAM
jgi:hypothetical protein